MGKGSGPGPGAGAGEGGSAHGSGAGAGLMEEIPPYDHRVLVGRWLEDKTLVQAVRDKFLEHYKKGVTQLQNTRRMKANLLKEVQLALPDCLLRLGDAVQVLAPDMPAFMLTGQRGHFGIFLAGYVDDVQVDYCEFLADGCRVLGSAHSAPCVRNSWRLCAEDGSRAQDGCPLRFGQCFTLAAVESGTKCPLYIRAECNSTQDLGSGPPTLSLSTQCDTYCRWRVLHVDRHKRPETEGGTFTPNMPVVLQHAASEVNLSARAGGKECFVPTFFGYEGVPCLKNYKDQYHQVMTENIWMLGSAKARDPRDRLLPCPAPPYPRPRARRPERIPTPPDPCPKERACPGPPPPEPLPPPEQRKWPCPADMPCHADVRCLGATPPPVGYCGGARVPPRAPEDRRGRECPRDPPCPRDCTCAPQRCPPPRKCLRWSDLVNQQQSTSSLT